MSKNSVVSLTLQVKGQQASQELKRIATEQVTAVQRINTEQQKLAPIQAGQINNAKKISDELRKQGQAFTTQKREVLALDTARKLGIRTEQQINAEIKKTRDTYAQFSILQRQGVITAKDLERAYGVVNTKVAQLNREMGKTDQISTAMKKVEDSSIVTATNATNMAGTWKDAAKSLAAMYGSMQAMNALRATVTTNLDFERDVLEMKQNAGMTTAQASEIRQLAIDESGNTLQTPQDVLRASKSFARAGDKFEDIRGNTIEAARAAAPYRSTPEQVANMDFDLRSKMGIKNQDIPAVNNMLYYHGNAGRFEMASFAQYAPEMLSAATNVGIKGVEGSNFVGALSQVLMNKASINEPGKVKTMLEQGIGHITAPHYVKGLKKFDIDVEKYLPNGQFYGDGGVEGVLALTEEMKRKGLTNPFKLGQAGFSDQETTKFWLSMMQYTDELKREMEKGRQSAKNDQIGIDLQEMQRSNFGKVKQAEITIEKSKLSETGQDVTNAAGVGAQLFSEHPVAATIGAGAAAAYGYKTYGTVKANGVLNSSRALARAGAVTTVGFGAYDAYSAYKNPNLSTVQKNAEYTKAGVTTASTLALGYAGAKTGAIAGAGIGAFFGGVGAAPGAAIGGIVGGAAGSLSGWWLGEKAGEELTAEVAESSTNQTQAIEDMKNTLSAKLDVLINTTQQNKPIPFSASGLLGDITNHAAAEEKRHGAPPPYMMVNK